MAIQNEVVELKQDAEVTASDDTSFTIIDSQTITVPAGEIWYVDDGSCAFEFDQTNDSEHDLRVEFLTDFGKVADSDTNGFRTDGNNNFTGNDTNINLNGIDYYAYEPFDIKFIMRSKPSYSNESTTVRDMHARFGIRRLL